MPWRIRLRGFGLGERDGRELDIRASNLCMRGQFAPMARFLSYLTDDFRAAVLRERIPLGRIDHRREAWTVIGFIEIQNMLSFFNVGIHIKCGRKPPSTGGQDEAVVSQMIVPIPDGDIERHASKELLEIGPDRWRSLADAEATRDRRRIGWRRDRG
jgi:hypothetical protein